MKWIICSLIVLASNVTFGLSLREAQAILIKNNPDLAMLNLEVERTNIQYQESQAAWFPSVDAFANYGYTTETSRLQLSLPFPPPLGTTVNKTLGDHDRMEIGVDATYPLFTGFTRENTQQSKQESILAKQAQWRGSMNQMSLKLGTLYFTWQLSQLHASYQEKVFHHSQALTKQLQDFVHAGTGIRSRALAAEAKTKAAEVDLLNAKNSCDSMAYELVDFLGLRDTHLFQASTQPDLDTTGLPLPDWEAQQNPPPITRAESQALDHTIAQNQYGQRALAGQKFPQIFGMAGYRYGNPGLNLNEDAFMAYGLFGLQLRWNLFDGSKNGAQRKQIEIQTRALREQKRKLEGEWWKAERTARVQFGRWQSQYQAAQASLTAAEAAASDLKRQFDVGLATGLDWLEARNQSARAEWLMAQAKIMQHLALLQWRYAVGKEIRY